MPEMEYDLLDLLVDGASSFASLYFDVRRKREKGEVEAARLLEMLWRLEERGLLRIRRKTSQGNEHNPTPEERTHALEAYEAWLPWASASEVTKDEVGLWFELTEQGRAAWALWSGSDLDARDCWVLEDRAKENVLEIRARWREVAESVLNMWLAMHSEVEPLPGGITLEEHSFQSPDSRKGEGKGAASGGVLLRCRYRRGSG